MVYADAAIGGTAAAYLDLIDELPDAMIEALVGAAGTEDVPVSTVEIRHWAGAMSRPAADAGPAGHRTAQFSLIIDTLSPAVTEALAPYRLHPWPGERPRSAWITLPSAGGCLTDDRIEPPEMSASPVDLATAHTPRVMVVRPAGAHFEQALDLPLRDVDQGAVAGRTPPVWLERRIEAVEHVGELRLRPRTADVCARWEGAPHEERPVLGEQDSALCSRPTEEIVVIRVRSVRDVDT